MVALCFIFAYFSSHLLISLFLLVVLTMSAQNQDIPSTTAATNDAQDIHSPVAAIDDGMDVHTLF